MAIIATVLSICALLFSVWLYLELQKKLSSEDIVSKLTLASDELSKNYARQFRAIETEWTDMYQKFSRLAGRVDKTRGLEAPPIAAPAPSITSRSDLLRKHRGGGSNE
jgi:hypothetical protein